ncbi:hypothetical protein jhhlp_004780 [Lomentospora prolificans]|uniref:beta-glucosidase n=1 Tax=Lomentospora prolificans TaxID=41688 RepID=A0A2N3N8K6_9PEZI|nr:hypothetical protein jhhlp_004780 [Lomentospora prolificans]
MQGTILPSLNSKLPYPIPKLPLSYSPVHLPPKMFLSTEESTTSNTVLPGAHKLVQEGRLPRDFEYGAATAAYQIEGGANQDGKGPSIWDEYSHREPSRTSGQNGDVACDHYNRVDEDVALLASYGVDCYRFSISWSRIIPLGGRDDPVNEKGIAFYNRLIDRLLEKAIKPVVTLYHWDLPLELEKRYGGFLDTAEFRADFENYARICFSRFGDRVKRWATFNEPYIISIFGYNLGFLAPGHNAADGFDTKTEPWRAGHSIIVSHAAAVEIYAKEFKDEQQGEISIVLNGDYYEPYNPESEADRDAAQRRMEFYIGWFADPIYLGANYPLSMRRRLGSRLPTFTEDERNLLERTAHLNTFYGMNHYTSQYARARSEAPAEDDFTGNVEESPVNSAGHEIGPLSGVFWLRATPKQFRKLLKWVWTRYSRPIYVTENGCPCPGEKNMNKEEAVADHFRMHYFATYLNSISEAIYEDGVIVKGYFAWSLMDNYEWSAGYSIRFGITHVDYDTLVRTPKQSAWFLKETMQTRRGMGDKE